MGKFVHNKTRDYTGKALALAENRVIFILCSKGLEAGQTLRIEGARISSLRASKWLRTRHATYLLPT